MDPSAVRQRICLKAHEEVDAKIEPHAGWRDLPIGAVIPREAQLLSSPPETGAPSGRYGVRRNASTATGAGFTVGHELDF